MNHWILRLFPFCMPAVLLLGGCQPKPDTSFLPVTGAEDVSLPAEIALARDNVLDYLLASSRLSGLPAKDDWLPAGEESRQGEYRFRSEDWLLVIWPPGQADENQRVILVNSMGKAVWVGHVTPKGQVVDTAYNR